MFPYVFGPPEHDSGVSFAVKHKSVPILTLGPEKLRVLTPNCFGPLNTNPYSIFVSPTCFPLISQKESDLVLKISISLQRKNLYMYYVFFPRFPSHFSAFMNMKKRKGIDFGIQHTQGTTQQS